MSLTFTHDFASDLELIDPFAEERFAFVRFADGECAIMESQQVDAADGWICPPADSRIRRDLETSLRYAGDGWHLGLSCPCCDPETWTKLTTASRLPKSRMTFSNLFANGNYARFVDRVRAEDWMPRCCIVASHKDADIPVAANLVNEPSDWVSPIVARMYEQVRPIILCAGPASNVVAYHYWTTVPDSMRQNVIDVGSAFDPWLFERATRGYHQPTHPNASKVCQWK